MRNYLFILLIILLASCDDALFDAGDCITQNIEISDFDEIYIENIFDVYLLQDTVCKISVKGGSNLIPNLEFNVNEEKILSIKNNNSASWSRSYDHIELYISVDTLRWFQLNAPSNVSCLDTIITPRIYIYSIDDYAELDFVLKSDFCYTASSGTSGGKITLHGQTNTFSFWARASFQVNAKDFVANSVTARSESIANCFVHANNLLNVEILRSGNIYYSGDPETIEYVNEETKDQLIKLD